MTLNSTWFAGLAEGDDFFASGERHVERILSLAAVTSRVGRRRSKSDVVLESQHGIYRLQPVMSMSLRQSR